MSHTMFTPSTLTFGACLWAATFVPASAQMAPQIPPSQMQGMMSHAPAGLVVKNTGFGSNVLLRNAGMANVPPAQWSAGTYGPATDIHADYSMGALLAAWPSGAAQHLEFADISTGGDISPAVNGNGELIMNNIWFGISVMLASNAVGESGSLVNQRLVNGQPVAGTIYSYYVAGSTGISDQYIDRCFIEQTASQLGYGSNPAPQISGLDWGMGMISVDPLKRGLLMFPVRNRFYFTITPASEVALNGTVFPSLGATLNAQTVYVQRWELNASNNLAWTAPEVAYSAQQLDLDPDDAIDMISVYRAHGHDRLIFSTAPRSERPRNQLLVLQRSGGLPVGPLPLRIPGSGGQPGILVTDRLGLVDQESGTDPDNIIGGCGKDPEADAVQRVIGLPHHLVQNQGSQNPLGMSIIRVDPSTVNDNSTSHLPYYQIGASGADIGSALLGAVVFEYRAYDFTSGALPWIEFDIAAVTPSSSPLTGTILSAAFPRPGSEWPNNTIRDDVDFRARFYIFNNGAWSDTGRVSETFKVQYWPLL